MFGLIRNSIGDKVGHVIFFFLISKEDELLKLMKSATLRLELYTAHSQLPHSKGPLWRKMRRDVTAYQGKQARASPPKVSIRMACKDLKNKTQEYQGPIPTY